MYSWRSSKQTQTDLVSLAMPNHEDFRHASISLSF
jgi:hypothetical protein